MSESKGRPAIARPFYVSLRTPPLPTPTFVFQHSVVQVRSGLSQRAVYDFQFQYKMKVREMPRSRYRQVHFLQDL